MARTAGSAVIAEHRRVSPVTRVRVDVAASAERMLARNVLAWFSLMVAVACGGSPVKPASEGRPVVTVVTPNTGSTGGGTVVTISGANFLAGATVRFGGTGATLATVDSSTSIRATTPPHPAGAVDVSVTNPGADESNDTATLSGGFTYTAALAVTAITPSSGPTTGGTSVTITGTNFQAGATVSLDDIACVNVVVVSSTSITCTTPAHTAAIVDVTVVNPGSSVPATLPDAFGYTTAPPPVVSVISPSSGLTGGGTPVTITGANFQAGAIVSLGGVVCASTVVVSSTAITCTTPAHAAGAVDVTVANPDGGLATLAGGFSYTSVPPPVSSEPVVVHFDSVATPALPSVPCSTRSDASNYLAGFGITFVSVVGDAYPQVCNASGTVVTPASPPNFFHPWVVRVVDTAAYDLVFSTPLTSIRFIRSAISGGAYGAWSAHAYNASNVVLSTVSEPAQPPSAAQSYVLNGPGIVRLRVQFSTNAFPPFFDDLVLTP